MASQLPDVLTAFQRSWDTSDNCSFLFARLKNGSIAPSDSLLACGPVSYTTGQAIVLSFVLSFLTVGTAGGNMLIIIAICIVRKLRSPANFLIVNLALTDFLVSILVLPFAITYQVLGYWPFTHGICNFYSICDVLLCTSSILSLCAISIDRYMTITKPLQYAIKRTPTRMLLMILISWVLSTAISISPVFGWKQNISPYFCGYSEELSYQIYATFTAFYIPITVMLVLYGKIFVLAKQMAVTDAQKMGSTLNSLANNQVYTMEVKNPKFQSNRPKRATLQSSIDLGTHKRHRRFNRSLTEVIHQSPIQLRANIDKACHTCSPDISNQSKPIFFLKKDNKLLFLPKSVNSVSRKDLSTSKSPHKSVLTGKSETHKAVSTLGVIMGCFTICWLPFFLCQLITPIVNAFIAKKSFYFPPTLFQIFLWLGYMNSFLNPIIYAQFNRDFRTPFIFILRCQCANINHRIRNQHFSLESGLPQKVNLSKQISGVISKTVNRSSSRTGGIQIQPTSLPEVEVINSNLICANSKPLIQYGICSKPIKKGSQSFVGVSSIKQDSDNIPKTKTDCSLNSVDNFLPNSEVFDIGLDSINPNGFMKVSPNLDFSKGITSNV